MLLWALLARLGLAAVEGRSIKRAEEDQATTTYTKKQLATILSRAVAIATTPLAAKADWIAISQDRTLVAWNKATINPDGSRDISTFNSDTRRYGTLRYRCDQPFFFVIIIDGYSPGWIPLSRGSAAETAYYVACQG